MQISDGRIKSLSPQELSWAGGGREGGEACGKIIWRLSIRGLGRLREKALQEREDLHSLFPRPQVMLCVLQEITKDLVSPLYYGRFLEQRPESNKKKTSVSPRGFPKK